MNTLLPVTDEVPRRRRWPWIILIIVIAVPLLLTLAGKVTSPPQAAFVPVGRILYLEADEPSDHTTLLRGLRITNPGHSGSHELTHETEPQDTDAGNREWITQPKASPDGKWLAYEKQVITLQEEKQAVVNQLWLLPLDTPQAKPRLLLNLTQAHLKQFVGLAWTPDSKTVVFLNDARACLVAIADGKLTFRPLVHQPFSLNADISVTRLPVILPDRITYGFSKDKDGEILNAQSPDGTRVAGTVIRPEKSKDDGQINITSVAGTTRTTLTARWGWSVFGGRRITSLKWSPDGKFLGYTVSKPPFEDELFYVDPATGQCRQLPIRTGRAAWDWTR